MKQQNFILIRHRSQSSQSVSIKDALTYNNQFVSLLTEKAE